jgi:hypothetical protein
MRFSCSNAKIDSSKHDKWTCRGAQEGFKSMAIACSYTRLFLLLPLLLPLPLLPTHQALDLAVLPRLHIIAHVQHIVLAQSIELVVKPVILRGLWCSEGEHFSEK